MLAIVSIGSFGVAGYAGNGTSPGPTIRAGEGQLVDGYHSHQVSHEQVVGDLGQRARIAQPGSRDQPSPSASSGRT